MGKVINIADRKKKCVYFHTSSQKECEKQAQLESLYCEECKQLDEEDRFNASCDVMTYDELLEMYSS